MSESDETDEEPAPLVYTRNSELFPVYIILSGGVLTVGMFVQAGVLTWLDSSLRTRPDYILGVMASAVAAIVIVVGGHWLRRSSLPEERYRRVFLWHVGSLGLAVVVVLLVARITGSFSETAILFWLGAAATLGGGAGLLVGLVEARSIEQNLTAQRVEMESEYLQRQRNFLTRLHALVRHEVLNTTQVISGHASTRLDDIDRDSPEYRYYETINDQSKDLAAIVEDIELLLRATESADRSVAASTNVTRLLGQEVEQLRTEFPEVAIELTADDEVFTRANPEIATVIRYLLVHRIRRFEEGTLQVDIEVETTGESVLVVISDDGPELPTDEIQSPFEQPPAVDKSHGWALYLGNAVVELYDGTMTLDRTGPQGTTVTIELPRGSAPGPTGPTGEYAASGEAAPRDLF